MKHKLICIVGMCGAGKSLLADQLRESRPMAYVRFGQITMDQIALSGQTATEQLERQIREEMRKDYGMAAYAVLNMPKIDLLLPEQDVIGDGLYSWAEYVVLREKYGEDLVVIAVFAPPVIRYARLKDRATMHQNDAGNRFRSFTIQEAASRDVAEIEQLEKGGPIAMANYTVLNTGTKTEVHQQLAQIISQIWPK